jgi:predicted enzyme related to lactoylglutathione lyase
MGKITGLGGAFLKAKDPKALYAWYEQHLGIQREAHGSVVFSSPKATRTAFSFLPESTEYFGSSGQRAMLNFRVDDLDGLLDGLVAAGVSVDPKRESYGDFGKFGWFTDPEGNRVELWQPAEPSQQELTSAEEPGAQP